MPLSTCSGLRFLTFGHTSCAYPWLSSIDHILVSSSLYPYYVEGSSFVFDVRSMFDEDTLERLSDHCPVMVKFRIFRN